MSIGRSFQEALQKMLMGFGETIFQTFIQCSTCGSTIFNMSIAVPTTKHSRLKYTHLPFKNVWLRWEIAPTITPSRLMICCRFKQLLFSSLISPSFFEYKPSSSFVVPTEKNVFLIWYENTFSERKKYFGFTFQIVFVEFRLANIYPSANFIYVWNIH